MGRRIVIRRAQSNNGKTRWHSSHSKFSDLPKILANPSSRARAAWSLRLRDLIYPIDQSLLFKSQHLAVQANRWNGNRRALLCVSEIVRKCFLLDISKTLLLLAVSKVPRRPSLPGMIIVTFAKRSPLLHCENNHDGRGTGDRPDSLYSYNPQNVAVRRISCTFGQSVPIRSTANGGQFGKFGQRDCTSDQPRSQGHRNSIKFGQSNGAHQEITGEKEAVCPTSGFMPASVHSQYRMPDSPIPRLC
jgi:hypothetical protein